MDNILLSLVVGIVSSLVATAIFLTIAEAFRKIVLPWYSDKIYRGIRLDGDWELCKFEGRDVEPSTDSMFLSLKQEGDKVTGTYAHKSADDPSPDIYNLSGVIRDRYLIASAVPVSNRSADGAAFLFYIHNENSKQLLTGNALYCDDPGAVSASPKISFSWRKP